MARQPEIADSAKERIGNSYARIGSNNDGISNYERFPWRYKK
jgi:hypothetical protein